MPANLGTSEPRKWLYGLTADEWLHLAAEGEDSEVGPCCGDISQLREWLNGLATEQASYGPSNAFVALAMEAYDTALAGHDTLADSATFPILHSVLEGMRAQLAERDRRRAARKAT